MHIYGYDNLFVIQFKHFVNKLSCCTIFKVWDVSGFFFFFLVSQKAIVIQQAVSCVGILSPYSCVESDVNKKDFEVIL